MDKNLQDTFLNLVRLGIGHSTTNPIKAVDWSALQALAEKQGLVAIIVDGIEKLPERQRPPKDYLLQMIGQVVQGYEYRYELYNRAIAELAGFYNEHDLKMMVLKGYACSINWPKPAHRPCGDIDIWLFGKQIIADALLKKEKNLTIDNSHEHHTVFLWRNFIVENHYDFIDVHHRQSSPELEKVFKELGKDDSHSVDLHGEKVYLPSSDLHALFLLRHMMEHFAATEITLRQVLDWGFYVQNYSKDINWIWLNKVLERYGMSPAFNIFNAICVDDLGFEAALFPETHFIPEIKERVLCDLIAPEFSEHEPVNFLPRIVLKYKRWKANEWKHRLCYNESMWSSFWSGVWSHLLKPSSI